jgi:hypothetical protein
LIGKYLYIVWPFGIFYGYLGYFMTIWYIFVYLVHFSGFGIMYQEKSGNPAAEIGLRQPLAAFTSLF